MSDEEKVEKVNARAMSEVAEKTKQAYLDSVNVFPGISIEALTMKALVTMKWFALQKQISNQIGTQLAIATTSALLQKSDLEDWMPDSESPLSDAIAKMIRKAIDG